MRNVGPIDRSVRIAFGVVMVVYAFVTPNTWLIALALISIVTGVSGYCPLYGALGLRTAKGR